MSARRYQRERTQLRTFHERIAWAMAARIPPRSLIWDALGHLTRLVREGAVRA